MLEVEKAISDGAEGLVLWVVLVFNALIKYVRREPIVDVEQLLSLVDEIPYDLSAFYSQMVEDLTRFVSESVLKTARVVLMWINVASRVNEFTIGEL